MALFVDFVGLNTLIQEPIDVNNNTVGTSAASRPSSGSTDANEVRNTQILTIDEGDYLAALNSHRNGPYGFPIFKQLRAGDSPIIRRQRLTNIFSHYEYPGETVVHTTGKNVAFETVLVYERMPIAGESFQLSFGDSHGFTVLFNGSGGTDTDVGDSESGELHIDITNSSSDTLKEIVDIIKTATDNYTTTHSNQIKVKKVKQSEGDRFGSFIHRIRALEKGESGTTIKSDTSAVKGIRSGNIPGQTEKVSRIIDNRRGPVEHFSEVPVVSKHRPLRLIGSVTSFDEETGRESLEPVQVLTTLGNETQYFSNKKINKFFNTENILSEDYEDFVDLYLEGGIDGNESPIDEFRFMQYRQVVYPKELYTYKNHTRNRINFVSRYWRDNRLNRTSLFADNGFGFRIISQSAWVLDGEENFKDLSFVITPGNFSISHPSTFAKTKALTTSGSAGTNDIASGSTDTFTFKDSGTGAAQRTISFVDLDHSQIGTADRAIYGYGGWPDNNQTVRSAGNTKAVISVNPYDAGTGVLRRLSDASIGLRGAFENRGFRVTPTLTEKGVYFGFKDNGNARGWGFEVTPNDNWRLKTTASTLSVWVSPPYNGPDVGYSSAEASDSNLRRLFASGTLYHETIAVTESDNSTSVKVSKAICFDPTDNGNILIKLGTVFTASHDGSIVYCGANEPGAIEYRTDNVYGVDNPIYKAARLFNQDSVGSSNSDKRRASAIAATSVNHFLFELNLSGSRPDLGFANTLSDANKKQRGAHFRARHGHEISNPAKQRISDPHGYARVYINGSASHMASSYDPYSFLSGSQGNFQQQLRSGNTSIKLDTISTNRDNYNLSNTDWPSINPFTSNGFAFSYWIKFGDNPTGLSTDNLIFQIQDESSNEIIDHTIGGNNSGKQTIAINFKGTSGANTFARTYSAELAFDQNTWYNVTFSAKKGNTNMDGVLQVKKKGQTSVESLTGAAWSQSLTNTQFSDIKSSGKVYVLPAGSSYTIADGGTDTADPDIDNVNIDSLMFFNGGLTTAQFDDHLVASTYGEPKTIDTANFPATDSTTALKAVSDAGALIHGRRTYELNTFRDTKEGLTTGRNLERGDRYYPFGASYKANEFQSGVLDAGDAGEFDMSFWFRATHENYRNRSIRSRGYGTGAHQTQKFATNITKRSEIYKGFYISFWFRKNGNYSTSRHTTILKGENNEFGILVGRDSSSGQSSLFQRKLAFWIQGKGTSDSSKEKIFVGPEMPNDDEWHFISIQWNGKTGPEEAVAFRLDGGSSIFKYDSAGTSTTYSPSYQDPMYYMNNTSGDYQNDILVLNSPVTSRFGINEEISDCNIAQLVIVENPSNPTDFTTVRNTLYNSGQFKDATDSEVSTALTNAAVDYGTAEVRNQNTAYSPVLYGYNDTDLINGNYNMYRFLRDTYRKTYFRATSATSTSWAPEAVGDAGGFTLSFYFKATSGTSSQWKSSSTWRLLELTNNSSKRVMQLYKGASTSNNLIGFVDFQNGTTTRVEFTNVIDTLCDGDLHHVIISYNGRTNGSGQIVDFDMIIDGTAATTSHSTSGTNANSTVANIETPTKLSIGGTHSGGALFPYSYVLGSVKLFKQYLGGAPSTILDTLRYQDKSSGNRAHNYIEDPQYRFPVSAVTISYTGGTHSITSGDLKGPVVDCMIAPEAQDVITGGSTWTVFNRANKTPVLAHYYRLGQEPEIRETPIQEFCPRLSINNSGSATAASTKISISSRSEVDSGPKHWNLEWYGKSGDVNSSGVEQARDTDQQENQQLFYVGDIYNDSVPRDSYQGIELYLTSSGGGYAIESAIGRTTTDHISVTAENLIAPNKWYHLYASYSGCTSGGTPALNLYLNGQLITMSNRQAGAGTFDVLTQTGTSYRPTIGGSGNNQVRPFSGYFQDIAFWNTNVTSRARNCRNLYDGIRAGSSYIDTDDSDLEIVHKTGFLAGDSSAQLTKIAGAHAMDGGTHQGLTSTDRAFVTGPPKQVFIKEGSSATITADNALVIAFWAYLEGTETQNILSFNSDAKFSRNYYINNISDSNKGIGINPTDNSGIPKNNQTVRLNISMRKSSGRYVMDIDQFPLYENNPLNVADQVNGIHDGATSGTTRGSELVHHVLVIDKDKIRWYENGSYVADMSYSETYLNADNLASTIGGQTIPTIRNGWNNITVMSEEQPFKTNSILDEVAVLHYDTLTSDSAKDTLASSLYNGGAVYNYAIRQSNLYAWWRMGENSNGSAISVGTTIGTNAVIDDESGTENDLYNIFSGRLQAVSRASDSGTDLKNYYEFNSVDSTNSLLPHASSVSLTDTVGSKTLTRNGDTSTKWSSDFSFDSYELHPIGWLATEGNPTQVTFAGDDDIAGLSRLGHDHGVSQHSSDTITLSDTAIFSGVSTIWNGNDDHEINDKTAAKTIIKLNAVPAVGDVLTLIANPRNVSGGFTETSFRIIFTNDSTVDTQFSGGEASIDSDTDNPTIATMVDRLENLLNDATTGLGTTAYTFTQPTNDTLVITAVTAGKDGAYEVIADYNGSATAPTISSVIGYSHIAKALTRSPNFGWVAMNDSDFSRVNNTNNFSNKQGLIGSENGVSTVKPFWYINRTYDGSTSQGNYSTNIGTSEGNYDLTVSPTHLFLKDSAYPSDEGFYLNSGSALQFILDNTPALDFNDITIIKGTYLNFKSLPSFSSPGAPKALIGGKNGARSRFGPGLLQNSYNQFAQTITKGTNVTIDPQLSSSACYFRRHSLTASTSFVAPNSGFLQKLSASHNLESASTALIGNMSASHLFLGSAKWEAGDFAGRFDDDGNFINIPKKPFYDTYKEFIADARPIMKDYGIVPEFRISDHVNDYIRKGPTQQKLNFLNITGGLASADSSEKADFYEIYSTTDFLKHFDVVQEDHSDFVDPFSVTLRCNVVKKFLPYEGFYPAQRSVQVAQQFYSSYADNVSVTASQGVFYDLSQEAKYPVQYLLNPLFSPGIMFNTIKSGVAVDYPLVTDTGSVLRVTGAEDGGAMIREQFDTRIPFEALIEPEKHLANITLAGNEPDPNANTGLEVEWGGQGDPLYNLMVSNFLAETSEFFLENKSFTSIASLSQGDANFGNAQKGNIYMMRLKMFRSTQGNKPPAKNHLSKSYGVPQDQGSMTEAFTMYSRPSAFGPPQYLSGSGFTALTWAEYKFDGTSGSVYVENEQDPYFGLKALLSQHDFSYVTGSTYGAITASGAVGNQANLGYNFPFTPPYYHGEAWADITFIPRETKKYSLQEIINQSSVEFYRYFAGPGSIQSDGFSITTTPIADNIANGHGRTTLSNVHDRTVVINDQAMQLASSVNIFSQGVLEQDISAQGASGIGSTTNVQVDTDIQNKYRWIIQTKFETPMLNFNHYTYGKHTNATARDGYAAKPGGGNVSDTSIDLPTYTDNTYGIELPGVGPMQTPIGMWHQYGHLPQNSKEGVFLQVDDIPQSWITNAMNKSKVIATRYASLANLCGFSTDPVRMGEVAGVKEVSEAVVKGGVRRFFNMKKEQIDFALDPSKTNLVGRTVLDMVNKMRKFVIPPSLDFVSNREIKPFSMYIFEFTHNFTKQDLADIWQNLPPELNETVETDQATISHQLLAYELLGRGGTYKKGVNSDLELVRNERMDSINPQIQWMVFKVKQRAKTNYFEKIFARNESQQLLAERLRLGVSADALGRRSKVSYNWPYDFFSMIEGVKMTAEVNFFDVDEEASTQQEKPVVKPKTKDTENDEKTSNSRRMFGALSGLVPPQDLKKTTIPSSESIVKKGKINRPRRVQVNIKNISNRIKQVSNSIGGKKIT